MNPPEPENVDPKKLRPGPIRNESLSPEVLKRIRLIYQSVGRYFHKSLEQFEVGFMRDKHPEREVSVWSGITLAWTDYHKQHLDDELLSDEEEKKLIGALVAISTGVQDLGSLGVPEDVGQKLLACLTKLDKEAREADEE